MIDPSGKLPNGQSFETFDQFKRLLMAQAPRFRRSLAEKMFVYALGRPVEPNDRLMIDALASHMTKNNDTLRSLIKAIVLTKSFGTK